MATQAVNASGQNVWKGMAIQWSSVGGAGHTVPACDLKETLPVPVRKTSATGVLRPHFEHARRLRPKQQYGNDRGFAILGLRGKLLPVSIHRGFSSKDDALLAAMLTDYRSDTNMDMWRGVTGAQENLGAAGWASVEHPDLQADDDCRAGADIVALVVETIGDMARGAYKVLYLRPVEVRGFESCFERIGIGRLSGEHFVTRYCDAEVKDLWLV